MRFEGPPPFTHTRSMLKSSFKGCVLWELFLRSKGRAFGVGVPMPWHSFLTEIHLVLNFKVADKNNALFPELFLLFSAGPSTICFAGFKLYHPILCMLSFSVIQSFEYSMLLGVCICFCFLLLLLLLILLAFKIYFMPLIFTLHFFWRGMIAAAVV